MAKTLPALYRQAGAVDIVASRVGLAPGTVQQILLDQGVTVHGADTAGLPLTDDERHELVRRYGRGASIAALACEYECGVTRMRHTLIASGAAIRTTPHIGRGRLRGAERERVRVEMAELYERDGWSTRLIAGAFEACHATVRELLREAGVTLRSKSEAEHARRERGGSPSLMETR